MQNDTLKRTYACFTLTQTAPLMQNQVIRYIIYELAQNILYLEITTLYD